MADILAIRERAPAPRRLSLCARSAGRPRRHVRHRPPPRRRPAQPCPAPSAAMLAEVMHAPARARRLLFLAHEALLASWYAALESDLAPVRRQDILADRVD